MFIHLAEIAHRGGIARVGSQSVEALGFPQAFGNAAAAFIDDAQIVDGIQVAGRHRLLIHLDGLDVVAAGRQSASEFEQQTRFARISVDGLPTSRNRLIRLDIARFDARYGRWTRRIGGGGREPVALGLRRNTREPGLHRARHGRRQQTRHPEPRHMPAAPRAVCRRVMVSEVFHGGNACGDFPIEQ